MRCRERTSKTIKLIEISGQLTITRRDYNNRIENLIHDLELFRNSLIAFKTGIIDIFTYQSLIVISAEEKVCAEL